MQINDTTDIELICWSDWQMLDQKSTSICLIFSNKAFGSKIKLKDFVSDGHGDILHVLIFLFFEVELSLKELKIPQRFVECDHPIRILLILT